MELRVDARLLELVLIGFGCKSRGNTEVPGNRECTKIWGTEKGAQGQEPGRPLSLGEAHKLSSCCKKKDQNWEQNV